MRIPAKQRQELKLVHGIAVVNRPDLLQRAINSVPELWAHAFIIDNSPDGQISQRPWPIRVLRPSVPLSVAQTMNYLYQVALDHGADVFGFQHNDAEAEPGSTRRFLSALSELNRRPPGTWAAMLTRYDILSAYRTAAVRDVGPWDTTFPLPNYHIDKDWFYRARQQGYEIVDTFIPVLHHCDASATIKSDKRLRYINDVLVPMNEQYYRAKWGGLPGEETFTIPWNGRYEGGVDEKGS